MLDRRCTLANGVFTCGVAADEGHEVLEFGSRSTATAAAYVPKLCAAWAGDVKDYFLSGRDSVRAKEAIVFASSAGARVRRHVFRGETPLAAKEARETEDQECTAGCRNPAGLRDVWPDLWSAMDKVRGVLLRARGISSDLVNLVDCCGAILAPRKSPYAII